MEGLLPLIVTCCAWMGGGVVSVVTGFGCGLFALPLMLTCVPTEIAIPVTCVMSCVGMSLILVKFWRNVDWFHFWVMTIPATPGVFIGIYIQRTTPVHWLELGFGLFLLVCAGWEIVRSYALANHKPIRSLPLEVGLALLAGIVGGVIGLGGPVMALYAALAHWDKDMTRGTFGLFFGLNLVLCIFLLHWYGLLGTVELDLVKWAVPGVIAGTFLGIPVAGRIPQDVFRKLLLGMILLSGMSLIIKFFV